MSFLPIMPIYCDTHLAETRQLTLEEHGAYIQLMLFMWRSEGVLPDDDVRLSKLLGIGIAKWKKLRPALEAFFEKRDGKLSQKSLANEYTRAKENRDKRIENGKKGGRPNTLNNSDPPKATGSIPVKLTESKTEANGKLNESYTRGNLSLALAKDSSSEDKSSSEAPLDFRQKVFESGAACLQKAGKSRTSAKSIIGKWVRDYGDEKTLTALMAADKQAVGDPVGYIEQVLKNAAKPSCSQAERYPMQPGAGG